LNGPAAFLFFLGVLARKRGVVPAVPAMGLEPVQAGLSVPEGRFEEISRKALVVNEVGLTFGSSLGWFFYSLVRLFLLPC
jgi:hypothetical protein